MKDSGLYEYLLPTSINYLLFFTNFNNLLKNIDEEFFECIIEHVKSINEDEEDRIYSINKRNLYEIGSYYRCKYPKNKEVYDLVNELIIMLNHLDPISIEDEENFFINLFEYRYGDFISSPYDNFAYFILKNNGIEEVIAESFRYDPLVINYLTTDNLNTQESLLRIFIGKLEPLVTINWLMKTFPEKFDKENLLRVNILLKNNEKLFLLESLDMHPVLADDMRKFNKKLIKKLKDMESFDMHHSICDNIKKLIKK